MQNVERATGKRSPAPDDDEFAPLLGDPNFVLSLARGLRVLEGFAEDPAQSTVAGLAKHTGLSRASVRRLLFTLERLGYAEANGSTYRLRPRVMRLISAFVSSNNLTATTQTVLDELAAAIGESTSISVLDRDDVTFLARSTPSRVLITRLVVGSRLPAYCTSGGRILLAQLGDVELERYLRRLKPIRFTPHTIVDKRELGRVIRKARSDGYSTLNQELEVGLKSVAIAVRLSGNRTAAINVCGTSPRNPQRDVPILRAYGETLVRVLE